VKSGKKEKIVWVSQNKGGRGERERGQVKILAAKGGMLTVPRELGRKKKREKEKGHLPTWKRNARRTERNSYICTVAPGECGGKTGKKKNAKRGGLNFGP